MGGLAPRPEDSRETRVVNAFRTQVYQAHSVVQAAKDAKRDLDAMRKAHDVALSDIDAMRLAIELSLIHI